MKIKCVKCEVEFAVRKDVMEKRIEKGVTAENYLCRKCRPKATGTTSGYTMTCSKCNKILKVNKKRIDEVKEKTNLEDYVCRTCRPKKVKEVKKVKEKKVKEEKKTNARQFVRDAASRFMKKAA
jgi:hypothetical protein